MKNKSKFLSIALVSLLWFSACQPDKTSKNTVQEKENQEINTENQQKSITMIYNHPITITHKKGKVMDSIKIAGSLETSEEGFAKKSIEAFAAKNKKGKTFNVLFIHYGHPEGAKNEKERTHKIKVSQSFESIKTDWDLKNKTVLAWYYNDNLPENAAKQKESLLSLIKESQLNEEEFLDKENAKPKIMVPKQSEGGILGISTKP